MTIVLVTHIRSIATHVPCFWAALYYKMVIIGERDKYTHSTQSSTHIVSIRWWWWWCSHLVRILYLHSHNTVAVAVAVHTTYLNIMPYSIVAVVEMLFYISTYPLQFSKHREYSLTLPPPLPVCSLSQCSTHTHAHILNMRHNCINKFGNYVIRRTKISHIY